MSDYFFANGWQTRTSNMTPLTATSTALSNQDISDTLDLYVPWAIAVDSANFDEEYLSLRANLSTEEYSIIRDEVSGINYLTASQIHTHVAQVGYIFASQYRVRELSPMGGISYSEFKKLIHNGLFKFAATSVAYHAPIYNTFGSYTIRIYLERALATDSYRFARIRFETDKNFFSGNATIAIGPM